MKLTTVLCAVNNNPSYYMFIPKQILFWKMFNIRFWAVFVGTFIPDEIKEYSENIILWNKNLDLNTSYVGQNIRIFYPALLNLPDDEVVMITDMDMLPMNDSYYKKDIEKYKIDDFIYYRNVDGKMIYMCYNAAHPKTWAKVFNINSEKDIEQNLYKYYDKKYNGIPGSTGWTIDQEILYTKLINYPNLKVLNRPISRLETWIYDEHLKNGDENFVFYYDDAHFHRNYANNLNRILDAEKQFFDNKNTSSLNYVNKCIFCNDNYVVINLLQHDNSSDFKRRSNNEILFRKINTLLINNGIIKNNIIDLGSWIGDNSIPWSKNINGIVYAIDPSEYNCEFIKKTCDLNNITNLKVIQTAVSDKNELLYTNGDLKHCSFVYDNCGTTGKNRASSVSLDYLYDNREIENIGYIHLDVEGMEYKVIVGSNNIIDKYRPIISFEQHLEIDNYEEILIYLINKNYKVFLINEILEGCRHDCRNSIAFPVESFHENIIDLIHNSIRENLMLNICLRN